MSECPPALSACVLEGERRETLPAELSGMRAQKPKQFLGVCILPNPKLIEEKSTQFMWFRSHLHLQLCSLSCFDVQRLCMSAVA